MPDDPKPTAPSSFSTAEVAQRLGVSVPTVQRWVDAGHLKAWKTLGGHRRIEAESAERLFQSQLGDAGGAVPAAPAAGLPSVIVVDDNPDDRDLLAAVVQTAWPGAALQVFENAIQALVAIGRQPPQVLITDIVMPYMDGITMLQQLAGRCSVRPALIVAVSASHDAQGRPRRRLPDGVRFVPKPIAAAPLVEMLRAAVRAGRAP